jgi:hypothetical protein
VAYKLSAERADDRAFKVLKYWAENPGIGQATVNDVIWTKQTLKTLKSQVLPDWLVGSKLLARGKALYWLSGRRCLHASTDGAQTWTRIGENLDEIFAGSGQLAGIIYKIPGLRWYNMSARAWEYFFLPHAASRVLLGPERAIYVLGKRRLLAYRPGQKAFEPFLDAEVTHAALAPVAASPRLAVVTAEKKTVQVYDPRTKAWKDLGLPGAERVGLSGAGVFASTAKGVFTHRGRWRPVAGPGWTFQAGKTRCFLFEKNRGAVYVEKKKKITTRFTLPGGTIRVSVDTPFDQLFALTEGRTVLKLGEKGTWSALGQVPSLAAEKKKE